MSEESGFDGIDRDRAQEDLLSFDDEARSIFNGLENECHDFFLNLCGKWASPIAKDYTTGLTKKYEECVVSFGNSAKHLVHGAEEAANILLKANGQEPIPAIISDLGVSVTTRTFWPCGDTKDGLTGMDREGVRILLASFSEQIKGYINRIDALPEGISFYDTDGVLVETYNRNLDTLKDTTQTLLDQTKKDMNKYIDSEIDNILMAKKEAQDVMNA